MKKFKLLLLSLFVTLFISVDAQNFFKPIPRLQSAVQPQRSIRPLAAGITAISGDSTFFALRPISSAVTIFTGGTTKVAAGVGLSYQNITQRASDGRNYVNYAASILALAGGSVIPNKPTDIASFGAMISALNNAIGAGYALQKVYNPATQKDEWKGGLMVAWTYNFNN